MFMRTLIIGAIVLGGANFVTATNSNAAKKIPDSTLQILLKRQKINKAEALRQKANESQKQADEAARSAIAAQQQLKNKQDAIKKFLEARSCPNDCGPRI